MTPSGKRKYRVACLAGDGVSGSCYGFLIPKLGHGRSPRKERES